MKPRLKSIFVQALAIFMGATLQAACAAKLDTDKKKISYALGQQIGETIKNQGLEVDVDILSKSIQDQVDGKKSELTFEEMRAAMMNARKLVDEKQKAAGEANKKKGQEYLEANKKKEGFKVTASGLQYKVLTEGKGKTPTDNDNVVAHYRGTLIDGTEFDSSYKRNEPAEFPVRGVIPGWTEALKLMKVGEKVQLVIPSELAYGEQGRPSIPPNSVLNFEIELIDVKEGPKAGDVHHIDAKAAPTKKKK